MCVPIDLATYLLHFQPTKSTNAKRLDVLIVTCMYCETLQGICKLINFLIGCK
jgi:hypothetical protein